jgi:hypothetical protein
VFSEHGSVWDMRDFERQLTLDCGRDPRGKFIVVQSHARIPMQQVRQYWLSFERPDAGSLRTGGSRKVK